MRAQALRQPVGHGGGFRLVCHVVFVIVLGFLTAETLPQPFQRSQRLGLGLAQQPAMNRGLAVAVDGDDGSGCGLHVRAVVLQAIFQRLQLFAQGFAFLLQRVRLFFVLGIQRGIEGFAHLLHLGLQLLDALRLALGRFAPLPRGTLESVQVGMGHAGRSIHPCPLLGANSGGNVSQLVLCQAFQQRGIGQIHTRVTFREQVAAHATACGLVGIQPDKTHQWMPVGVDFALGQALTQRGRLALPRRRIVERAFLRCVVIGDGKCHQLVERDGIGAIVGHQARRNVRQLQAALHHQRRHAEIRRNVLDGAAFGHQRGERLELVCRVHGFALHVLGEAGGAGRAIGHQQARHLPFLGMRCFFASSLRAARRRPPATTS
jgi:hypothetical protein